MEPCGGRAAGGPPKPASCPDMVQKPAVLLLDEPFSNLDPDMAGKMREDLHDLLVECERIEKVLKAKEGMSAGCCPLLPTSGSP